MKKQILFLTVFVAAILVGTTSAFAQGGVGRTPNDYESDMYLSGTFSCIEEAVLTSCDGGTPGPLNPTVGTLYNYEVTVRTPLTAGGAGGIHWYVYDATTDPALFKAINDQETNNIDPGTGLGAYIMEAGATYGIPVTSTSPSPNIVNNVDIRWKSFDGTSNVVLLVAFVLAEDGCTDNIEVYRIQPQFNFSLNIASLSTAGAIGEYGLNGGTNGTGPIADCVAPIESASYDGTTDLLTVNYGEDYVYFAVNAANFTDSWMPTFEVSYDGYVEEALQVDWAYPADAVAGINNWHTTSTTATVTQTTGITDAIYTSTDAVMAGGVAVAGDAPAVAGNGAPAADGGECIIVRVKVDHGEVAAGENDFDDGNKTLTLGVDGIMYDAAVAAGDPAYTNTAYNDLHDNSTDCVTDAYDNDYVTSTLTPRPAIATDTDNLDTTSPGDVPFEDKTGTVNTK